MDAGQLISVERVGLDQILVNLAVVCLHLRVGELSVLVEELTGAQSAVVLHCLEALLEQAPDLVREKWVEHVVLNVELDALEDAPGDAHGHGELLEIPKHVAVLKAVKCLELLFVGELHDGLALKELVSLFDPLVLDFLVLASPEVSLDQVVDDVLLVSLHELVPGHVLDLRLKRFVLRCEGGSPLLGYLIYFLLLRKVVGHALEDEGEEFYLGGRLRLSRCRAVASLRGLLVRHGATGFDFISCVQVLLHNVVAEISQRCQVALL